MFKDVGLTKNGPVNNAFVKMEMGKKIMSACPVQLDLPLTLSEQSAFVKIRSITSTLVNLIVKRAQLILLQIQIFQILSVFLVIKEMA